MIAIAQDSPGAASAVFTRKTAHRPCAQPFCPRVRLSLTESEAAKIGILPRWQSAWARKVKRDAAKQSISNRLQTALSRLMELAAVNEWSQRKLAAKIGVPESTLRKISKGQSSNPVATIQKLESALARLNPKDFLHER